MTSLYMLQINMLLGLDYEQIRKLQSIYSFNALLAIGTYFCFLN